MLFILALRRLIQLPTVVRFFFSWRCWKECINNPADTEPVSLMHFMFNRMINIAYLLPVRINNMNLCGSEMMTWPF